MSYVAHLPVNSITFKTGQFDATVKRALHIRKFAFSKTNDLMESHKSDEANLSDAFPVLDNVYATSKQHSFYLHQLLTIGNYYPSPIPHFNSNNYLPQCIHSSADALRTFIQHLQAGSSPLIVKGAAK